MVTGTDLSHVYPWGRDVAMNARFQMMDPDRALVVGTLEGPLEIRPCSFSFFSTPHARRHCRNRALRRHRCRAQLQRGRYGSQLGVQAHDGRLGHHLEGAAVSAMPESA